MVAEWYVVPFQASLEEVVRDNGLERVQVEMNEVVFNIYKSSKFRERVD